jgi:heme exporter protein CcmD
MSGHWPYIVAAYSICFVLFAIDWFASSLALRQFRKDFTMRLRREQNAQNQAVNRVTESSNNE